MTGAGNMQLALALPLIAVVLTGLFGKRPNLREAFNIGVATVLLVVMLALATEVFSGGRPEITIFEMLPSTTGQDAAGFAIALRAEPLGMLFGLVASSLWIATTCYAIGYMRGHHEKNQTRFYACFGLAIFAAVGAAFARNLFTLFVFYEILTLSTYPLVTHHGTPKAQRGGRTYLAILLTTSIAFLMFAIAWTWQLSGRLDFVEGGILTKPYEEGKVTDVQLGILLAFFAFGIGKAALMPFHRWLPAAMVAPTPVSALLHAVAVVKVGVFTVMKVAVYIFGLELLTTTGISVWLMYCAAVTVLLASLIALTKDNLKARLAYSTISQLAYIVLGAALANGWGVVGGSMHIAMHAVGKITLFFCAGAIYVATNKTEISEMRGIGRVMPLTMTAFLLGSFSIIGLPPFGGAWSKLLLARGALQADQGILVAVLMISSLLNVAYLLPVAIGGFYFAPDRSDGEPSVREAPMMCVIPLCVTALGGCALFFAADYLYDWLLPIV